MRKRRLEEGLEEAVAQSSVDEAREAHLVSEDREGDTKGLANNSKDEEATNTMTTGVVGEAEEAEDLAGGITTSPNEIETPR